MVVGPEATRVAKLLQFLKLTRKQAHDSEAALDFKTRPRPQAAKPTVSGSHKIPS